MGKKISFPLVIFERRKAEELRACWKRHLSIDMQVSGDVCHSAQKTLKHFGRGRSYSYADSVFLVSRIEEKEANIA